MIQDLHSHTYYSFCGLDTPEEVVETAIMGGIEVLGITDHNHGVGNARLDVIFSKSPDIGEDCGKTFRRYFDHINLIKEKYADRIKVLRGIEVTTHRTPHQYLHESTDISFFDYCIVENLDMREGSITNGDIISFAERCGCMTGIAHTDMFAHIRALGEDPLTYFKKMAERGIFWEMNVNYDKTHNYRKHQYVLDFFADEEQQNIVRRSGVKVSIGFDGHRVEDYRADIVTDYNRRLDSMGIGKPFDE